jgi:Holliday junction resolvase RusA-like endonuclease
MPVLGGEMSSTAAIKVIGTPGPKGSKSFKGLANNGRAIMVESSKLVKPWSEAVIYAARESGVRIEGPVVLSAFFTVRKPRSAPKRRKTYPSVKPDIDKYMRCTLDALVAAGTIEDDGRVIDCRGVKCFPGEHEMALDVPGAVILLRGVE